MNAGDLMYLCHNYNLEVIKTTIIKFSVRQVAYPIGQLVAFKKAVFTCVINHSQSLTKVGDSATLQGNRRNVKSDRRSLLQEALHVPTSANQEVREMDPKIARVMVSQCIERQLV